MNVPIKTRLTSKTAIRLYPGLLLVLLYSFQMGLASNSGTEWYRIPGDLVLLLAPVYLNLIAWFPKGLRTQRYWLFWLGNSVTVAVVTLLPMYLAGPFTVSAQPAILNLTNALSLVLLSTGYQYAIDYFKERRKQQQLAQKQMETELQMLRMQLNPHFLFNTLNNLYGLAITKSDHLPGLMLKLSELLRYLHDEAQKSATALTKEIGFLENYVELQRLRLSERVTVTYQQHGDPIGYEISPALLINFVENAFKHLDTENPEAFITINLSIVNDELYFEVKNSTNSEAATNRKGTGLSNIQQRLQLLYPDKHALTIEPIEGFYRITLNLSLV